ncbi:hypothetical protein V6N12_016206 [Hibiscus sabdariffa]|uniref:Uncharacterized protein n=1 Tax=Hibiscus sabdariffa TaxID=183260 RepID=A0ABR2C917_9ROSI
MNAEDGRQKSGADVTKGPPESHVPSCVEGVEMEDFVVVLQRCLIGWCRSPISNSCLVEEIRLEKISGVHVMRLAGSRVLLIFDSVEVRQQVMHSGEDTLGPLSFERGRVLIETTVIDRIEEHVEFSVGGRVFPVRISESDTLLRGPPGCMTADNSSSSGESEIASNALKPVAREDQLVDVAVDCVGPIAEGSNIEVLAANGCKWKVRLLSDIISSLQTPEEKQ